MDGRSTRSHPAHVDDARLLGAERLEDARGEITAIRHQLERAPRWRPSRGLIAQCDEALELISTMRERLKRKLVVAIVGPTGAGKSTLLNALAGVDGLSESGVNRPTTRDIVVFCKDADDASPLVERLGTGAVGVVSSPAAYGLEHVVLVDTPDINSAALDVHRPVVEAVIGVADVLVTVFNVENPKSRDNADFLAPFVAAFPSRFVMAVLNHCDRQDEGELKRDIRPDFQSYLRDAWDRPPAELFCISARRHLRRPAWPAGAEPRHDFDEFDALRETLFGSLNKASVVADARIARAKHLTASVRRAVRDRAAPHLEVIDQTRGELKRLHGSALGDAATALSDAGDSMGAGLDALYYQRLASSWWGPVGWLVGIWARVLIVGTGFAKMMRMGKPLKQLWGMVTSLSRFKQSRGEIADAERGAGIDLAALRYRAAYDKAWPDIAERLVDAGFSDSVRDPDAVVPPGDALEQALNTGWNGALNAQLEESSARLSGLGLQLFLNAWVLVPAAFVAGECVIRFVNRELLGGDYFRHAFLTMALLWFLAFAVFQLAARATGGKRLLKATFKRMLTELKTNAPSGAEAAATGSDADTLGAEIAVVQRLGRLR